MMDTEIPKDLVNFEIVSESPNGSKVVFPLVKRRSLVGRGQACDIVLPFGDVSTIHCVLEITKKGLVKVYDLNSKNGTRVKNERVVVADLNVGEEFHLGDNRVLIRDFKAEDLAPPPLNMLSSLPPTIQNLKEEKQTPDLPKAPPSTLIPDSDDIVPRIQYPLAKDPKAEFSEYIFEDAEELYPIFKYNIDKSAVEIIIVFNDRIQSVDYLSNKEGVYSLVGRNPKSNQLEYPYLGVKDVIPFINIKNGEAEVLPLEGYGVQSLGDTERENLNTAFFLYDDEIVRFENEHIQIFVRKTAAPPRVAPAPILRRDQDFKKYLLLMLMLVSTFLGVFYFGIEVDKEIEKEKAPERIATILYKRRPTVSQFKAIDKTKEAPKKIQKSPKQEKSPKKKDVAKTSESQKPKTASSAKSGTKTAKKVGKVKKADPNKGPEDVKKTVVRPTQAKKAGTLTGAAMPKSARSATKSKGAVDTYRSADFKSTVSSLISKGGSTRSAKAAANFSEGIRGSSISEAETGATLKTAKVSNNTGSLAGVTSGTLDSSKGVEGLVDKKKIYTAGLPYKTVILGSIDPDVIRQILVENIPRFRDCYQSVLDRSKRAFNGIVRLNFIIGASGYVTKAGVDSMSTLPSAVKGCVVNVLRRIPFPEPAGGGVVEVNQPMNFYPKVK